jgi:adenylate kinase family enzyme
VIAMQRVLIVGPCGAGKSTLARHLGARLNLPIFHLDQLNWHPGWIEGTKAELRAKVAEITAGERWLIDGTYGSTLTERLPHADTVVYLDYPVRLCVSRLLQRIRTYRGRSRPDMPENCPERLDLAFLWYVMRWNAGPGQRLEARLQGHEDKVIRLHSPAALDKWLLSIGNGATPHDMAPVAAQRSTE